MAGPFMALPRLSEFIARAEAEFGCQVGEAPYEDATGRQTVRYLVRDCEDGGVRFAKLPGQGVDKPLTPSKLRNLCAQLDIDHTEFGLPGDYPEFPDDFGDMN